MPTIDVYAAPRADYDACLYNNDTHNAVEACTCDAVRRPCYKPRDQNTNMCLACNACGNCATFYQSKAARNTHRTVNREKGQPMFPNGLK